jgi:hypothetical protein
LALELDDRFMAAEFMATYMDDEDRSIARLYAEKNLTLRRELGDLDGIMSANMLLALLYFEEADIPRARMFMEEAHQLAQIVRNPRELLYAELCLGILFFDKRSD